MCISRRRGAHSLERMAEPDLDDSANIEMPPDDALNAPLDTDDTADKLPPVGEPLDENRE